MKRIVPIACALLVALLPAAAQEQAPAASGPASVPGTASASEAPPSAVLTLQQSIDEALANGDDNRLLQANLELSRAQHEENLSRNSWGLSATAGAGYNLPGGDRGVLDAKQSSLSAVTSSTQGAVVGLGAASPLTSVSVSASPWAPPVQVVGSTIPGIGLGTLGPVVVNLSQVLWNGYPGGPARATVDKSVIALQGKVISTASGKLAIVYRVKQAYYAMLAAQENARVTRQILDKQNALLAQVNTIFQLKQASAVDQKTAQINARSAQVDVQNADHGLRIARLQLSILMGRQPGEEFTVMQPEDQPLPAASLEEAISQALARRVDFQQLELARKSNAVDLALARGLATPTVSVNGGVSQAIDVNAKWAWLVNAGVKVTLPILDAGAAQHLIDAAAKQDQILSLQERQLQKSIAAAIQNDWETVQILNERVEVARMAAENDDLLVEVYRIQNQNGAASTQDLLTASVNAAGARTAYVQAKSNAQLAVLQMLSDMGY